MGARLFRDRGYGKCDDGSLQRFDERFADVSRWFVHAKSSAEGWSDVGDVERVGIPTGLEGAAVESDGDVGVVAEGCAVGGPGASAAGEDEGLEDEHDIAAPFCVITIQDPFAEGSGSPPIQQLASCEGSLELPGRKRPFTDEHVDVVSGDPLSGEFSVVVK